jgi:hypothetical protein
MKKILISILIITIVILKANAETLYGGKPINILSSRVSDLESVVKGYFLSNITGINYDNTTGNFDLDIGYIIPTSDLLSSFLTGETDPVFVGSQAYNVNATHINVLNNTSGLNTGDQDLSSYFNKSSDTADNITIGDINLFVNASQVSNWDTAHNWGDHSIIGYLLNEADPVFSGWDKSTGVSIYENQISDLQSYLTSESDPVFANSKDSYDSHLTNTSNPHSVTKAQIGLSNVTDNEQIPISYLDTDGTLSSNSDSKVSSQKAVKTYVDALGADPDIRLITQYHIISELLKIVTTPSNIKRVMFFDETGAVTILKDKSGTFQNITLSKNASDLDPSVVGSLKFLDFNAADEYWEFTDSDDLSFGDGSTDSAFSVICLINPNNVNDSNIISKMDSTTASLQREWRFEWWSTNYIRFGTNDNGASIGRRYTGSLSGDIGSWHTYIGTYNGNSTNSGFAIYRDGTRIDDANSYGGTYTAMSNTSAKVGNYEISTTGEKEGIGSYKAGFIGIIAEELSQTQVEEINKLLKFNALIFLD